MPTFTQYKEHIMNAHGVDRQEAQSLLFDANGDIDVMHTQLHLEATNHQHNADGSIVQETKTVMNDKVIKMTADGWSFDSTVQEALTELNGILNNIQCTLNIVNDASGRLEGRLDVGQFIIEVAGSSFIDVVRLLLGEGYNGLHERNNT